MRNWQEWQWHEQQIRKGKVERLGGIQPYIENLGVVGCGAYGSAGGRNER
jgi:hypothetical protein